MNIFLRIVRIAAITVAVCVVTGCVVLPYGEGRGPRGHFGYHHGFAPHGHYWGHR